VVTDILLESWFREYLISGSLSVFIDYKYSHVNFKNGVNFVDRYVSPFI
jgi:hypothetical protein